MLYLLYIIYNIVCTYYIYLNYTHAYTCTHLRTVNYVREYSTVHLRYISLRRVLGFLIYHVT